jgi:hypothetical protein
LKQRAKKKIAAVFDSDFLTGPLMSLARNASPSLYIRLARSPSSREPSNHEQNRDSFAVNLFPDDLPSLALLPLDDLVGVLLAKLICRISRPPP